MFTPLISACKIFTLCRYSKAFKMCPEYLLHGVRRNVCRELVFKGELGHKGNQEGGDSRRRKAKQTKNMLAIKTHSFSLFTGPSSIIRGHFPVVPATAWKPDGGKFKASSESSHKDIFGNLRPHPDRRTAPKRNLEICASVLL